MHPVSPCPNCHGGPLFLHEKVAASSSHGPNLLPGLGRAWGLVGAKFDVVVCGDCGLTRFFASEEARARVRESSRWHRL